MDRDIGLFHCDYCGGEAIPQMGEDGVQIVGDTGKHCPTCEGNLADALIELRPLMYCQYCRGMLVSIQRFLPLIEHMRALRQRMTQYVMPRSDADAGRAVDCPLCGLQMHNHPYAGGGNVHIETCEPCAVIWLDRDELQKIVVAPDRRPVYSDYDADLDSDRLN
jgi:Zn-finger nucleic acid-binding protein